MHTLKEYQGIIEKAIDDIKYPTQVPSLYEPIAYAMEAGGKRLRPILLLASNEAFGGTLSDCLMPALAIEMFHNFTLVHDDVMDNADIRRGRPTVYKKWNLNAAVLSGDAMVSLAYRLISGCPVQFLPIVLEKFTNMTLKVYEGQQLDEEFESRKEVSFEQYIQMIMGKTSALIAYPCAIGALIAGANTKDLDAIFNFGVSLGIAFQIQDDYLDTFGDAKTFGKEIGGDILNDKKTWLYIMAQDREPELMEKTADSRLTGQEKIKAVTEIYENCGLRELGENFINMFTTQGCENIKATSMPDESKEWFVNFAQTLLHRKK